jgi:DNA-directed RNA polymerase specialized sigma24 family protein
MEAVAATAAPADDALARVRSGDRKALAAFYESHFDDVFDFVLRIVRRRSLAAAVVRRTFAAETLYRDELFTTARDLALEALRIHRRSDARGEDREAHDFTQLDAARVTDPSGVLFDRELVELVWECAATLSPEDYAVLDLRLRQGLATDEPRFVRICDSFEDTVTSTLVMTRARRGCERLDVLVAQGADLTEVRRHAGSCRVCQESKRRFVSPLDVFAAFAPIAPPRGFRAALWAELQPRSRAAWRERLRAMF